MKVISQTGRDDLAVVYIAEDPRKRRVEFVESLAPPAPREEKWVNIVSTLFGCPVGCAICDAGADYSGKLSVEDILFQIDFLVRNRYPSGNVTSKKWKIQFARMGEPAYNANVLEVLKRLPDLYDAPGLLPSISTIAPRNRDNFFKRLLEIKRELYPEQFQFQFSIHSTSEAARRKLIPVDSWSFAEMATYGERFFDVGGRKTSLNFALMQDVEVDAHKLHSYFDPKFFIIKLTPLNPTFAVESSGLRCDFGGSVPDGDLLSRLNAEGYEVIVSVGELEENAIGSNCGQFVEALNRDVDLRPKAYSYEVCEIQPSLR